ncbi:MAG: 4-oxalocrotonate tautomerase family protein [Candidatus Cloacimonetes bacterium]|jgi:4-oxalocrotonate tautomerase|nr:4-oxalocrotonate tautomerase family protein [Candidatus Cloacimonadota bacterium]
MPVVTIANAGKLSSDQKNELILKVTEVISEVTGKSMQAVYVRIDEVPRENFGVGGKPLG